MPGSELQADLWVSEYVTPWDVYLHGVTAVLAAKRTEWQDMQIVETGAYGKALVLDGKWQSCTGDEFCYHEPLVHPACVLRTLLTGRPPESVLILGGGEGATSREALRWSSVKRCAMVDIDGEVVEACREHLPEMHRGSFDDPRHELVIGDALAYIAEKSTRPQGGWDVVISDLSDPIEHGPSFQLFTKEYFEDLRNVLAQDGVLVVQSGFVAPPAIQTHARLVSTLKAVYKNALSLVSPVPTYPCPWSFIVASDLPIAPLGAPPHDPDAVDSVLAQHTTPFGGKGLVMLDGVACRGLFATPKHLRDAIACETEVFTKERPPRFFGTGVANS